MTQTIEREIGTRELDLSEWASERVENDALKRAEAERQAAERERQQSEEEQRNDTEALNWMLSGWGVPLQVEQPCIRFHEYELRRGYAWRQECLKVYAPAPADDPLPQMGDADPESPFYEPPPYQAGDVVYAHVDLMSASDLAAWLHEPRTNFPAPQTKRAPAPKVKQEAYRTAWCTDTTDLREWLNDQAEQGYELHGMTAGVGTASGHGVWVVVKRVCG